MAKRRGVEEDSGIAVLVVGAGRAGQDLVAALRPRGELRPVAFLDDGAPAYVAGLPVLGGIEEIADVAYRLGVAEVVIALPSLPTRRIVALIDTAVSAGLGVRYLPSGSTDVLGQLRTVDIADLLGRSEIAVASLRARRFVTGKRVMVTGAAGVVGTRLCRRIRDHAPTALYQLDKDERRLRRLDRESDVGESVVVDVTDVAEVGRLVSRLRPDIVFHAAGVYGGPPSRLVTANVCGTRNVVTAAVRARTERFVLVSSDHAADPESPYGASYRLAELAVQAMVGGPTVFAIARVGDVIDADGSLLSLIASQAVAEAAVTLTHPDVTSFLMTTEEAVGLVMQSASMAESAETFVLDTGPPTPAVDLVRRYAAQLRLPEVTIRFAGAVGRRHAKLLSGAEDGEPTAYPYIAATRAVSLPSGIDELLRSLCVVASGEGDGEDVDDEVRAMLVRILPEYRPRETGR